MIPSTVIVSTEFKDVIEQTRTALLTPRTERKGCIFLKRRKVSNIITIESHGKSQICDGQLDML
ncbi:hypothetical protein MAR_003766 [Mya arenaria]|uniref:Uncharacterized protein n=1 Tax=Mya arenaria TaxID=6604 RepID=A0ABY7G6Z8_MYAAR|nr:hypothetical protein MAR_003766 [Mya arenaria]